MNKMTNNDIINTIGLQEELEDTKCVIRTRKSKKNRQRNSEKTKVKRTKSARNVWRYQRDSQTIQWPKENGQKTNIDQQNTTQKTRYRATLMAIKTVDKRRWYKMVIGSCSTSVNPRVTVKRQEHHLISKSYWTPVVVSLRFLCECHLLIRV